MYRSSSCRSGGRTGVYPGDTGRCCVSEGISPVKILGKDLNVLHIIYSREEMERYANDANKNYKTLTERGF